MFESTKLPRAVGQEVESSPFGSKSPIADIHRHHEPGSRSLWHDLSPMSGASRPRVPERLEDNSIANPVQQTFLPFTASTRLHGEILLSQWAQGKGQETIPHPRHLTFVPSQLMSHHPMHLSHRRHRLIFSSGLSEAAVSGRVHKRSSL